jgi:hypothetical protein
MELENRFQTWRIISRFGKTTWNSLLHPKTADKLKDQFDEKIRKQKQRLRSLRKS